MLTRAVARQRLQRDDIYAAAALLRPLIHVAPAADATSRCRHRYSVVAALRYATESTARVYASAFRLPVYRVAAAT